MYLFSKITPTPFVVSIFDAYVYPQVSHATVSVYFYILDLQLLFDVSEFFFVSNYMLLHAPRLQTIQPNH